MEKDFNKFIEFISDKQPELIYDITHGVGDAWKPEITLSKEDIELITNIGVNVVISYLRQYHEWLKEDAQDHRE